MKVVRIVVPPDKSISHRAVMLASISQGKTHVKNLLMGTDCLRTIAAFRAMGVKIRLKVQGSRLKGADVFIEGVGMQGLRRPRKAIYLGNSGTTMRILPGILAGQDFEVVLKGDASLSKRPMGRIAEPLKKMGATIDGSRLKASATADRQGSRQKDTTPPLKIKGGKLKAIRYKSKIASAQVKSCILMAGLYADGVTTVSEPVKSRDHTERMLKVFGSRLKAEGSRRISIKGHVKLKSPGKIDVPGDISSAAFFLVAGCLLKDKKIIIKKVGLNPTRTGIIDILKKMKAKLATRDKRQGIRENFEPMGDIIVKHSELKGITIDSKLVVRAIDEMPIVMVVACFAKGRTTIKGIGELRVKETDRIKSMVTNLRKMGADISVRRDKGKGIKKEYILINGGRKLHGATVSGYGDHRTAMSMIVAGITAGVKVKVTGLECMNKSFPGFQTLLNKITKT